MSLINDALKEAQRERSGRGGQYSPPLVASLFPYPQENKRRPGVLFIGAIIAAIVIVGGTAFVLKDRIRSVPPGSATVTQSGRVAPKAATPAPTVAAAANVPSTQSTQSKPVSTNTPATPPAPPMRRVALVSEPVAKPSTWRSRVLKTDSGIDVSPPAPAPAVVATSTAASAVRLVMDSSRTSPADSLSRLAYVEHMKNNVDAARDLYEKAIATKTAPAEAFNNYGVLLEQQGNPAMAAEMFRQAIARDDANVEAWVNLGDSFLATDHHAAALAAFDRARQLDPTRTAVKIRLANEYMEIGDTASARRTLEETVRSSPRDPRAHYAYGSLLQLTKDYRGAIREFDLFVEHVDKAPGEFTPEKIAEVKRHIVTLRRVAP